MNSRILIVEDDDAILLAIRTKLAKAGYDVVVATEGIEGIRALKEEGPFNAVLLDLRMPKGDGFQFLEEKKADPKLSAIPSIVFTNLSQAEHKERALALGATGYLIKAHHSLEQIIEELNKSLRGEKVLVD